MNITWLYRFFNSHTIISKCRFSVTCCPFWLLGNQSNPDLLRNFVNLAYDIAVIVLKDEIVPGRYVKIARLPDENVPCPKGKRLVVSGWGGDVSRYLVRSEDSLWAVSQECLGASSCPILNVLNPNTTMVCVGDPKNILNSACGGDSGGMFFS